MIKKLSLTDEELIKEDMNGSNRRNSLIREMMMRTPCWDQFVSRPVMFGMHEVLSLRNEK